MGRPVLVTGQHRSGSTWVGKTLAASDQLGYIKEPFNPLQRPGICSARPDYWFPYVHDDDPGRWQEALKKTLSFEYDLAAEIESISSIRDTLRMVRDFTSFTWKRWHGRRPLMKDPIALFSSEWIAKTFDADVILLIWHTAAFISSLLRLQWEFPFDHLANQATLMEDHLSGHKKEIREYSRNKKQLIDQGILLWKIFAQVIEKLGKKMKNGIYLDMKISLGIQYASSKKFANALE